MTHPNTSSENIGYTTGVFDLFHIGHLNILRSAKSECSKLIVGLTTDELCFQLKGKYPVIPFEERKQILEAIKYVDRVVAQERIDELGDWDTLRFQKIFKGSDWQGTPKWEKLEEEFAKQNVAVCYFPYTDTTSSTLLKKALVELTKSS